MNPSDSNGNHSIELKLCKDPVRIVEIFKQDYFDSPICYFPSPLLRALGKWISDSDQMFLVTAEVNGRYAGFTFGHILGPSSIWKKFARAHLWHFVGLLWVWLRIHLFSWVRSRIFRKRRRIENPENLRNLREMNLPRIDRPFAWSPDNPRIGCAELTIVGEKYRGLGLGPMLVNRLFKEMSDRGAYLVEMHADSDNYAAVRYLLKAGCEVSQMKGGDFYLRKGLSKDQI
jgi:GNAT superfamily N-acetyltransferase